MIPELSNLGDIVYADQDELIRVVIGVLVLFAINIVLTYISRLTSTRRISEMRDEVLRESIEASKKYYVSIELQLSEERQSKKELVERLEKSEKLCIELEGQIKVLQNEHATHVQELGKELRMLANTRDELVERLKQEAHLRESLEQQVKERDYTISLLTKQLEEKQNHERDTRPIFDLRIGANTVRSDDPPVQ